MTLSTSSWTRRIGAPWRDHCAREPKHAHACVVQGSSEPRARAPMMVWAHDQHAGRRLQGRAYRDRASLPAWPPDHALFREHDRRCMFRCHSHVSHRRRRRRRLTGGNAVGSCTLPRSLRLSGRRARAALAQLARSPVCGPQQRPRQQPGARVCACAYGRGRGTRGDRARYGDRTVPRQVSMAGQDP